MRFFFRFVGGVGGEMDAEEPPEGFQWEIQYDTERGEVVPILVPLMAASGIVEEQQQQQQQARFGRGEDEGAGM